MNAMIPPSTLPMMKAQTLATSFAFLTLLGSAPADTFKLKDGTTLEGRILRKNADSYVIEVNVTKTIRDERVIPKSEIVKITEEEPDLIAFQKLEKLMPAPDLLSADEYDQRIQEVNRFLKENVGSSKTRAAKEILEKLKSEANEILAGGKKIDGKIIPPSEYRANLYDIDARILGSKIKGLARNSQMLLALRGFSELERDFRNTNTFTETIPFIDQVINHHVEAVTQTLETYDARVKERIVGLDRMSQADRRVTENAIREENARFEANFKSEKDSKIGWVTPRPFFKPSLEETLTFAKQEQLRLATAKSAPVIDGGKIFRETLALILSRGDTTAISTALSSARTAGIGGIYMQKLEEAAQANGALK
jgi:hypothetical protein